MIAQLYISNYKNYYISNYRFGFNGKENDNEVKGTGNSLDFGARIYDPLTGRWLSLDPLQAKYPNMSAYIFCINNPIMFIDPDGKEIVISYFPPKSKASSYVTYKDGKLYNKEGKVYEGNNEFILNVKAKLDNLKNCNKNVNDVINDLQNSKNEHIIANRDNLNIKKTSYSRNLKDKKDGSFIQFAPEEDINGIDNKDFSEEEILAHELKHSWNIEFNVDLEKSNTDGLTPTEIDATNFQNIIRETQGKEKRIKNGKKLMNKKDLIDPANYKLQKKK